MIPSRPPLLVTCLPIVALLAAASDPSRPVRAEQSGDLLREAFQGVAFGATVADVTDKLEGQYEELRRVEVDPPVLPLARKTETHLIALDVHSVGVEEVAFSFADDALVMVEARGGVVDALLPALEGEPDTWLDYEIWLGLRAVALPEEDVLWLLGPEALHPHLYLWENPNLPSATAKAREATPSARRPETLAFGATLEAFLPPMQARCPRTQREEIDPPWLPTGPSTQVQINCYGVSYAGFPRKIEAVFGDERLQLAWILTGKGEEDRIRQALVAAYGEPIFLSKSWEVFDEWRVALRKDKPEVLMIADELVPAYSEQIRASDD